MVKKNKSYLLLKKFRAYVHYREFENRYFGELEFKLVFALLAREKQIKIEQKFYRKDAKYAKKQNTSSDSLYSFALLVS